MAGWRAMTPAVAVILAAFALAEREWWWVVFAVAIGPFGVWIAVKALRHPSLQQRLLWLGVDVGIIVVAVTAGALLGGWPLYVIAVLGVFGGPWIANRVVPEAGVS
jgi:hypothetical protein